jgi:hypothetical protein
VLCAIHTAPHSLILILGPPRPSMQLRICRGTSAHGEDRRWVRVRCGRGSCMHGCVLRTHLLIIICLRLHNTCKSRLRLHRLWRLLKTMYGDRPGIGAPGHLFKSARVATYYNVLHYIMTSSHEGYCWPEQLAKRDIMCLKPLERCWTTILVKDWRGKSLMEQSRKVSYHPGKGLGLLHIHD